jgi:predicted MFS family arabinose efflux permease
VPILPLVAHPAVLRAVVLVLASAPFIAFVLLWTSKYLRAVFHVPQSDVGHYLWLPPLCFDVGSIVFGAIATRRDRRDYASGLPRRQHTLLVVVATLLFLVGVGVPRAYDVWSMIVLAGIAAAGGGGLYALVTADMLARVGPESVSTAGGITAAAQSLAYIIANIAIGDVVQRTHSYTGVTIALSLLVLPGTLFWITRRVPREVTAP